MTLTVALAAYRQGLEVAGHPRMRGVGLILGHLASATFRLPVRIVSADNCKRHSSLLKATDWIGSGSTMGLLPTVGPCSLQPSLQDMDMTSVTRAVALVFFGWERSKCGRNGDK